MVKLEDIECIFNVFVNWVYINTLPADRQEMDEMQIVGHYGGNPLKDDLYVTTMVKAYIFGDRFLAVTFRNAVYHQLVEAILCDPRPPWFHATKVAFPHLPEDDVLLMFLIDIDCRYCRERDYLVKNEDATEVQNAVVLQLPAKLLLMIMAVYSRKTLTDPGWWANDLEAGDYHGYG